MFSLISSACASFWNTRHTQLFLFDGIHPIQQTTEVESGVTNVAVSVRFIHFALDRPIPPLTVRTHSQAAYSECHFHQHSVFFSLNHCIILAKLPHLNSLATKPLITPTRPCTIIGHLTSHSHLTHHTSFRISSVDVPSLAGDLSTSLIQINIPRAG